MRLDHLLSKETSREANAFSGNVLRSVQGKEVYRCVIQFRGYSEDVPKEEVKSIWANSSAG